MIRKLILVTCHGRGTSIGFHFSTAVILSGAKDLRSAQREILRSAQDDSRRAECLACQLPIIGGTNER